MQAVDCCRPPCPTVPPVNVPGTPGADAYTFTTESFVIPDVSAQVVVQVLNTNGLAVGENVILTGPANFSIFQINGPTTVTLTFLGYTGDLGVASICAPGASVIPAGQQGPAGATGQNGYGTTTSAFTIPSIGNTVVVPVASSSMFVQGQYVVTPGPANFLVYAIPNETSVTLQKLSNATDTNPGVDVATGSNISPAGEAGGNAWSTLSSQITIPAVGNTVLATVDSTDWMTVGATVIMPGPAHFSVTTINSATQVTLTFLGYSPDLQPGNFIVNGSVVAPSGSQGPTPAPAPQSGYGTGTAYTLTASLAPMTFGTTQPNVTLPTAGTWVVMATAIYGTNNGTAQSVTLKTAISSSTQGVLANSTQTNTATTGNGGSADGVDISVPIHSVYVTTTVGDTLVLQAAQTVGGTMLTVNQASIIAYRIL